MKTVFSMHPADAEMHGITNNMPVRVTSRRGEIVLRATVTEKTSVGVVFIPSHGALAPPLRIYLRTTRSTRRR